VDLRKTLNLAIEALQNNKIDHALIGGFALAHYGIMRATQDIDLIVNGDDVSKIKNAIIGVGFTIVHESSEILQFAGPGYLDLILAKRPLSLEMLKNAKDSKSLGLKIISAEGIIGLKIQAFSNDPTRELKDLADIQLLTQEVQELDWILIKKYADLFGAWEKIKTFKK
jgi:hypothetical protein